jgi:hypothetical protein
MTPKRIARGPEAARAELARWGQLPLQRGRVYGDVRAMRDEALRSRETGKGSTTISSHAWYPSMSDVAVSAVAIVGGFFLGRWWMRRHKAQQVRQKQEQVLGLVTTSASSNNLYLRGTAALAV